MTLRLSRFCAAVCHWDRNHALSMCLPGIGSADNESAQRFSPASPTKRPGERPDTVPCETRSRSLASVALTGTAAKWPRWLLQRDQRPIDDERREYPPSAATFRWIDRRTGGGFRAGGYSFVTVAPVPPEVVVPVPVRAIGLPTGAVRDGLSVRMLAGWSSRVWPACWAPTRVVAVSRTRTASSMVEVGSAGCCRCAISSSAGSLVTWTWLASRPLVMPT